MPTPEETRRPLKRFLLKSEECELLLALEQGVTLSGAAQLMARDSSVVSRQLQRLAGKVPVLEKRDGMWALTAFGKQLTRWSSDAIAEQQVMLSRPWRLSIATTREFGARVLAPSIDQLFQGPNQPVLSLSTSEEGAEGPLLSGEADLGFDCGRPRSPLVKFRMATTEPLVVVAAPKLTKEIAADPRELSAFPHLEYTRLNATRALGLAKPMEQVIAYFNDIASTRAACCAGRGWALLPRYAVQDELGQGKLQQLERFRIEPERFGVWWLRERKWLEPWVGRALTWLKAQSL
jgi:DNA-binding transcriptional LysR family regulator